MDGRQAWELSTDRGGGYGSVTSLLERPPPLQIVRAMVTVSALCPDKHCSKMTNRKEKRSCRLLGLARPKHLDCGEMESCRLAAKFSRATLGPLTASYLSFCIGANDLVLSAALSLADLLPPPTLKPRWLEDTETLLSHSVTRGPDASTNLIGRLLIYDFLLFCDCKSSLHLFHSEFYHSG